MAEPILFAHTDECDGKGCNETQCDACPRVVNACHMSRSYIPGLGETHACHVCSHEQCGYCEL